MVPGRDASLRRARPLHVIDSEIIVGTCGVVLHRHRVLLPTLTAAVPAISVARNAARPAQPMSSLPLR